ncbi:PtsGHI operon antiterminator [compost metagenome]|uniref:PRD domain-containing protein n=2 Tax=Paenibacillus rhizolycopersici TaxID=2780073 RepID=A0ABS2HBY1_9BACL|nr:PRD domain-containing protein [Paenibacillus sp. J53TS2]MBM6997043.1 PRD domain-containing protein [Paenibacillus rhizolycopersici]GIP50425.1 PtsGHI operon antiterminator [Paenibacillus sp. J53TS2]
MNSLRVSKVLNNNVIIANHPERGEVVVIGKGIGFNRKTGDSILLEAVEKMFILTNQQEQEQYKQLVPQVDEQLIEIIGEIIMYISQKTQTELNEHIHIALTDHLAFAIKRAEQDIAFHNPFLFETKEIYPVEFELAEYAIRLIKERLGVDLGEDEIGFVALHINSAMTNRHISEVRGHAQLIADLVGIIETELRFTILRNSLDYSRLLTHLRFAIERIRRGEQVSEVDKLEMLLKQEYPTLYSLAYKLTKVMEQRLKMPVYQAEVSYLTMHLHRVAPANLQ